jgi:hypothetical protein
METIVKIGGYIILFSVLLKTIEVTGITKILSRILSPFGITYNYINAVISAVTEVTNGCSDISKLPHPILLCAAALSWGGFSIHAQSFEFIKKTDLNTAPYILCRIFQTAITLIYGTAFSYILGIYI